MSVRNISWEIILAGIAFIGISIYLLNSGDEPSHPPHPQWNSSHSEFSVPEPPPMPSTIVIDLQNLENLKNLKNLNNLENLENLEIELKNLEKLIDEKTEAVESTTEASVEQTLKQLEQKLQNIEKSDFNIKLQDRKVYINRNFEVEESSWSETSSGVFVYRKSFNTADANAVGLTLGFGSINIVGGDQSKGELVLQATGDIRSAEDIQKKLAMVADISDQKASFSISSKDDFNLSDKINLEATLTLPEHINLDVKTSGGHISANHLNGNQNLFTSGGHITLEDIEGETVAKTNGGHITSNQINGTVTLSTSGGHIKVDKASGNLNLSTGGGHIEIQELSGQGNAKTSGGNISASILSVTGPVEFNSSAGNISILLPRSINADIDIEGSQASIEDQFDFSGTKTNGKITGKINGGGVPITASCGYGNVVIKTHD